MDDAIRANIRKLRSITGLTQEEFAAAADVSRSAVAQYESGFTTPRIGTLERLARNYHIPKSWLVEPGGMDGVRMTVNGTLVKSEPDQGDHADADETTLLGLYRSCSDEGRRAIMASAEAMAAAFPRGEAVSRVGRSA